MQKSYWIWKYGDYEIYHSNRANSTREEFGAAYPVFWKLSDADRNVRFFKQADAEADGTLILHVKGFGNINIDGRIYPTETPISISKGDHWCLISVTNMTGLPAAYIESDVLATDDSWVMYNEEEAAAYDEKYDSPDKDPMVFPFSYEKVDYISKTKENNGVLFDFGKELFGYLNVSNVSESDKLHVSYGESKEEALDTEPFGALYFENVAGKTEYKLRQRAFRYIFIEGSDDVEVSADYEYLPLEYKGAFRCDNEDVNKIWDICAYTLHLTTREVMLEAVKRDRWLWGGDAYQAYKFSNYLFFDKEAVRRSTIALRGKEPFTQHINTITDYSFYWVIGLMEYYQTYGDLDFIRYIYPKAVSLMEFSSKRVNADGFIDKVGDDWIFIDWADIDKEGALSAEQMLYIAANRTMATLARALDYDGEMYDKIADEMTEKVNEFFWDDEKGAFIDTYESGKRNVTRHANIFAVMYGIATEEQVKSITDKVLMSDDVPQITTPYFEGYELDVMGMLGNFEYIENKVKTYWKGMLDLGATTVWEEYNPDLSGAEHYAMYGKKYGKSLCHAWGAAPIYLFGKYFLGVTPESGGYETFKVQPYLGGFGFIEGTVPITNGEVKVYLSKEKLSVTATREGGKLVWNGKEYTLNPNEEFYIKF